MADAGTFPSKRIDAVVLRSAVLPEESLLVRLQWFLLNLVQAAFTGFWTALWITIALVVLVVTRRRDVPLNMARTVWAPGLLWGALAKIEIVGKQQIDWSKPHVFVMNHQSMIDVPVAFMVLQTPLRFISKKALSYVPFLGWYMRATGMIFVDRGHTEEAVASIQRAGERIREGASVLAFPEGTRSIDGSIGPFKKGIFVVAIESGVPIVPVAIEGAGSVLARDGFRVRPGTIRVKIGEPIPTQGLAFEDRDELREYVRSSLIALHSTL